MHYKKRTPMSSLFIKNIITYFKILILNVGQFRTHNKKFIFCFAVKIASAKIKAPEAKVEITI